MYYLYNYMCNMYIFKNTGKSVCYTQFQAQIMYSFKQKKWRNQKEKRNSICSLTVIEQDGQLIFWGIL